MVNEEDNIIYLLMYYNDNIIDNIIDNNNIIGYVSYKIYIYNSTRCLYIKYACTDINFRNKNINILLNCLVFADAINKNIHIIISQTNEISGNILHKKFGFALINADDTFYKSELGQISCGIEL